MEPLLILLVIPFIAFMMLRADSLRRNGLDPQTREAARKSLPLLSVVIWLIAALFLYFGFQEIRTPEVTYRFVFVTTARLGLGVGLLFLGWKSWRISKHIEQADLPLQEVVRRDLEETTARITAILFILLPFALPVMVLLAFVGFIPLIFVGAANFSKSYILNQLLWAFAIATKNQSDLAIEVQALEQVIRREQNSVVRYVFLGLTALVLVVLAGLLFSFSQFLGIYFMVILIFIAFAYVVRRVRLFFLVERLGILAASLNHGQSLSKAMSHHPQLFSYDLIGAVDSAAEQGDLSSVLSEIATADSRNFERKNVAGSLTDTGLLYVVIVFAMFLQMIGFMMYWVIPKFNAIFEDFGVELSAVTQLLVDFSDIVASYWYLLGPLICLPFFPFVAVALMSQENSNWVPNFILRMFPRIETPQLLRRLGYVADQRVPLQPSLQSLAHATPDLSRSRRFERLENRIELGDSLGQALNDEGFVNTREAYSIDNAATSGHLGWALTSIADSIQQRRRSRSSWALEFIRPLMIIFLAVLVGFFCIAMFMPLVKLLNELS
ncbi:type II secretion system F family protein [Thalassoglobus sp.]|uniref:type II secretion system F family protein n=1 Tax=Thalassoglobus sp. TaxID=2795869 RepID=UPI003AA9B9BA